MADKWPTNGRNADFRGVGVAIAWARTRAQAQPLRIDVDAAGVGVRVGAKASSIDAIDWEVPTQGTVIGTLLNYRGELAALGDAMHKAPYLMPPRAPVLYIKPANTWIAHGARIPMPANLDAIMVGAALGIVIGSTATRVAPARAMEHVMGYTVVNDVHAPNPSLLQLAMRERCRDGFCPIGPWVIERAAVANPDALGVRVFVNGTERAAGTTANLVRSIATLIADVSEFMTLSAGDVLLAGVLEAAPRALVGDRVRIEIDGIGALENPIVGETRP
jgi:5-oxopent-3-ene-1,2,5-tricarboxylate decarboxylase/2-hydroxyhepta-2,4-diene-1,7-dioate isomerase